MTGVIYLFTAFFRRAKARENEASEERQTPVTRLPPSRVSGGSQWGGGFYGYRLKFWLFYGYRLIFSVTVNEN